MSRVPFYDLTRSTAEIRPEIDEALARVINRSNFVLGDEVAQFEAEFASYCGTAHCVGVGTGLDALTLILRAIGVGPGDEVLVPGHTFIATWLSVTAAGARPIGVDVDPQTGSMDLEAASSAINSHTAAIMPVHLYGHPVDTSGFAKLAARYGIPMIEDAAQAHGAKVGRQRVGSFGAAAGFSFYPSKNLGALGDAGAVVTNDVEIDRKVRMLRNYGSSSKYVHDILGTNSRLDEIQAAVLRVKLRHLDEWNADRIRAVNSYLDGLASTEVQVITPIPGSTSSWHLLVVRSNQRDALSTHLDHEGVGNLIHYPTPPHLTRAYIDSGRLSALPITERTASEVLSLPLFPGLTSQEIDDVVEAVATFERKSNG